MKGTAHRRWLGRVGFTLLTLLSSSRVTSASAQAAAVRQSIAITACDTLRSGEIRKQACIRTVRQDSVRQDSVSKSALLRVATDAVVDTQWTAALNTFRRLTFLDSTLRNPLRDSTLSWAAQARFDLIAEQAGSVADVDASTARAIGFAWEQRGVPDRALEYYATMASQLADPRANLVYGRALVSAKRFSDALRVFSRATDSASSDADVRAAAWIEMAKTSVLIGRPATATGYLERARCAKPAVAQSEEWLSVNNSARRGSGLDTLGKYRRQSQVSAVAGAGSSSTDPCRE